MIIAFAGSTAPNGWFICDGREVSRTEYSRLFALIGVAYGNGDGTTTFNIPDLRECTPVGSGTNETHSIASHDTYEVGEFKDDQFQGHHHSYPAYVYDGGWNGISVYYSRSNAAGTYYSIGDPCTSSDYGDVRIGNVTRGKRFGVNYIIKY